MKYSPEKEGRRRERERERERKRRTDLTVAVEEAFHEVLASSAFVFSLFCNWMCIKKVKKFICFINLV